MENHPIPQDVTGFQFRLIGSLTLKQFGYIGASVILVMILYYVPGLAIYIKIPLMVILGSIGPALAFLPIEGRPMDQMASHFVHALLRPNQYLFIKAGGKLPLSMIELRSVRQLNEKQTAEKKAEEEKLSQREEKLNMYLRQIHQGTSDADKRENAFVQNVLSGQPIQPQQAALPSVETSPSAPQAQAIQVTPPAAPTVVNTVTQPQSQADRPLAEATPQVSQAIPVPTTQTVAPQAPTPQTSAPVEPITPGVRAIAQDMAPKVGIPTLPAEPNLILGIVKDSRGNILPNMLVEIKDKDENPVRAFKTNMRGQFAAATPLPNGSYTIVFEDPKGEHNFDVVALSVDGSVIPTIEIISHDAREALRQQLFG
jgi:hypothetical protein